jgi:uncharacterized membrane protein
MRRLRNLSPPDAATLGAAGVFLICWGIVHRFWWARGQITDIPTYLGYGDAVVKHGQVPYRDFAMAYPPASLPAFVLPSLTNAYATVFSLLMAACGVGVVYTAAFVRRAALPFVAISPLLVGSLVFLRFDLWPSLLVVAAVACLVRGRDRAGWALLGFAVAAKLWPLALVPLALAWSRRRGRANVERYGIATAAAWFVPFWLLSPHGVWESIREQLNRPLQVESLGGALAKTFAHPRLDFSHGSQNVAGYGWLATILVAVLAVSLVALWIAFARGPIGDARFVHYCAAVTCAIVAFDKVLSPQYLIWLVPLVPLVRGRRGYVATGILAAALLLTQAYFPWHYWGYAIGGHRAGVVLARDLALVALLGVLSFPERRGAAPHTP